MSRYTHKQPSRPGFRTGEPWTPEEDQQLLSEVARGMTNTQIAQVHGRSRNAIELRIERARASSPTGRAPAAPPWPYAQPVTNRKTDPQVGQDVANVDYSMLERRVIAHMSVKEQVELMANRPVKGVVIGSAFDGQQGFADTRSGTYWETLPKIEGDALRLQANTLDMAAREKARLKRKGLYRGHE